VPGVISAEADLNQSTLVVTFDPSQADKATIIKTIEDLGYEVASEFRPSGGE